MVSIEQLEANTIATFKRAEELAFEGVTLREIIQTLCEEEYIEIKIKDE
jgi:hypothetical protein